MKRMMYSETDEKFDGFYEAFKSMADKDLLSTFNKNWLSMKEVWILKDRILINTLRNHTTNPVECHNQKLKMVTLLYLLRNFYW